MPNWLIRFCLKYGKALKWVGTIGMGFGGLVLVTGIGVYSGIVEVGNVTEANSTVDGVGALVFFPLFLITLFGWIRYLPRDAKKAWMWQNLSKEEKDKLEIKFDLR